MGRYVLKRLAQAVVVLFGVSIVTFALIHLVPGDPVRIGLGTRFDPELYEQLRERAGLDQPLIVQYFSWLTSALTGDLGVSFRTGRPVSQSIAARLLPTLSLGLAGLVVALVIALPLGIVSAIRRGRAVDYIATVFSQMGISIPDFWMGIMLILLVSLTLGWLPPSGYASPIGEPLEWLRRVTMPALTIGVVSGSILTRFVRSSMLEVLGQDYTRTAESKGLRERVIVRRHVLRNALLPVITMAGLQLAFMLGGVIVVEVVFAWPGLGALAYDAVLRRDYPLLQGAVLVFAIVFVAINLLVDLLYAFVDPRIKY